MFWNSPTDIPSHSGDALGNKDHFALVFYTIKSNSSFSLECIVPKEIEYLLKRHGSIFYFLYFLFQFQVVLYFLFQVGMYFVNIL